MLFRLQNNVPEVYVNQSRDFQLFCRLYDAWQGSIKYQIDKITDTFEPTQTTDNLLSLLASRVGFFPRVSLDANVMRYIIAAFPYIIRNKGTEAGIVAAVNAILKAENDPRSLEEAIVTINNKGGLSEYSVTIQTQNDIYNKVALREVMRYVLPFGYTYQLARYGSLTQSGTSLVTNSNITDVISLTQRAGSVRSSQDSFTPEDGAAYHNIGTYNTGYVVGSKDVVSLTSGDFPNTGESEN